jgi:acyl-homoserine-lactone acylase
LKQIAIALFFTLGWVLTAISADLPGTGQDEGKTVIYRDTWGIPHIYAPTDDAGLYAQGYAIAEDRPERLLLNLLTAKGELASVKGEAAVASDLRSHMWDHFGVAKRGWNQMTPVVRKHLKAFAQGINDFYRDHPEDVPEWWQGRAVDPYMLIAFGRLFLYNWSIDEAYGDLMRGGINPEFEAVQRGSNQFAVSPSRSAEGAAILAIDPHLNWFGPSRFWEFRIHAGDLQGSGVTLAGFPYIGLGHNANVAWAMTTGGPDTADVFELTLNKDDANKYLYDDKWLEMTSRTVTLQVKGKQDQQHTLQFSVHGPIIATQDGKAYAAASAYTEVFNASEAWYKLVYARNYSDAAYALDTLAMFPQNVMVADTSGNIYYQRTGRVPRRAAGYDWTKPVDGSILETTWSEMHDSSELLHLLNPEQGFMQNCNVPPDAMLPNSPFSLADYPDYIYSSAEYGEEFSGWTNQRGARAIERLSADDSVTAADAMSIINDIRPFGVERWIEVLKQAHEQFGRKHRRNKDYDTAFKVIVSWNMELHQESSAALIYFYWRRQLSEDFHEKDLQLIKSIIDDWYASAQGRDPKSLKLDLLPGQKMLKSFVAGLKEMKNLHGSVTAVYGDRFRVGRGGKSWPVSGGGEYGTRTLRSMGYGELRDNATQWGSSGQTSTQVVVLSKPIKSWIYLPLGQSDREASPHFDDQAEKLFSSRQLKSSWWTPEELLGNIKSRTVLEYAVGDSNSP